MDLQVSTFAFDCDETREKECQGIYPFQSFLHLSLFTRLHVDQWATMLVCNNVRVCFLCGNSNAMFY